MTTKQYEQLWWLFSVVRFKPSDATAIDKALKLDSYGFLGAGWDSLIGWIQDAYSVSLPSSIT
jgi:hypothetical protein